MPVIKPKPKPAVTKKPATISSSIILPTKKSKRAVEFKDYITLFFGQAGVGKTTFVNQLADRVLILSTDRGTRFIEAISYECLNWETFNQVLTALEKGQAANFDVIAIDHVDDWANMAETYVLQKLGVEALADAGYGKGWSLLKKEIVRFIQRLKRLNLGIVFIAHEEVKTVKINGIDVDKCQPKMSKQAWDAIVPLIDIAGHCALKPVKTKDGKRVQQRVLETQPRLDLYAKDRTDRNRPTDREWEILDGRKFAATFNRS